VLLDLGDEVDRRTAVLLGDLDPQRVVDARELAVEDGVDDDAPDLDDLADVVLSGPWISWMIACYGRAGGRRQSISGSQGDRHANQASAHRGE
jgi:hypothetical protein